MSPSRTFTVTMPAVRPLVSVVTMLWAWIGPAAIV